jgi:hypothetical protein
MISARMMQASGKGFAVAFYMDKASRFQTAEKRKG